MSKIASKFNLQKGNKEVDITTVGSVDTLNTILRDSAGNQIDVAKEGGNLASINEKLGLNRTTADAGMIANGSISFAAGDDLTTEKKTSSISLTETEIHPDDLYLLAIEKPTEDTAGDLTVKTYNVIKIDGTNERDVLHTTNVVEKIASAATYSDYLIQGLFIGEGKIKIGMSFAADSGAIEVKYRLYRL